MFMDLYVLKKYFQELVDKSVIDIDCVVYVLFF